VVSQELAFNTNTSVSTTFLADQWKYMCSNPTVPVASANTDPAGNYLRLSNPSTNAPTVGTTSAEYFFQIVEGTRIADFQWGTANAKPAVLRFTARCAGVASFVLSACVRSADFAYTFATNVTLSTAWQDFTIPIPGPTVGSWPITTGQGLLLTITAQCGSDYTVTPSLSWVAGNGIGAVGLGNLMAVAGTIVDVKNVGLYLDPNNTKVAPPWETPDFAAELLVSQRYWETGMDGVDVYGVASGPFSTRTEFKATKRVTPAVSGVNTGMANCSATSTYDYIDVGGFRAYRYATATGTAAFRDTWIANSRF
jgi:hypothetical protein